MIVLSRTLADLNKSSIGATFVVRLARFKAPIAASSEGRASLRLFSRWDLVSIVWMRGSCEGQRCGANRGCQALAHAVYQMIMIGPISLVPVRHERKQRRRAKMGLFKPHRANVR